MLSRRGVVLGSGIDLHPGIHGSLRASPPSGYHYVARNAEHVFLHGRGRRRIFARATPSLGRARALRGRQWAGALGELAGAWATALGSGARRLRLPRIRGSPHALGRFSTLPRARLDGGLHARRETQDGVSGEGVHASELWRRHLHDIRRGPGSKQRTGAASAGALDRTIDSKGGRHLSRDRRPAG